MCEDILRERASEPPASSSMGIEEARGLGRARTTVEDGTDRARRGRLTPREGDASSPCDREGASPLGAAPCDCWRCCERAGCRSRDRATGAVGGGRSHRGPSRSGSELMRAIWIQYIACLWPPPSPKLDHRTSCCTPSACALPPPPIGERYTEDGPRHIFHPPRPTKPSPRPVAHLVSRHIYQAAKCESLAHTTSAVRLLAKPCLDTGGTR